MVLCLGRNLTLPYLLGAFNRHIRLRKRFVPMALVARIGPTHSKAWLQHWAVHDVAADRLEKTIRHVRHAAVVANTAD